MNVGFIGLGKLGLPCALSMSVLSKSTIYGYDKNANIKKYLEDKKVPYIEKDIDYYLNNGVVKIEQSIDDIVSLSDIIFVAVQTPHEDRFDGTHPLTEDRKDFDYSYLIEALTDIKKALLKLENNKSITISIISTVLPGTFKKYIYPIFSDIYDRVTLVYNPYFIAMGTTIDDFLNPEFILVGQTKRDKRLIEHFDEVRPMIRKMPQDLLNFYSSILPNAKIVGVEIESAEIIKISYNTYIGFKIIFGNLIGEIAEKNNGDSDEVIEALSLADNRIMSSKYLWQGFADGGGCHPRDHIAMSWFAKENNLSTDMFEYIAKAREAQIYYWAKILKKEQEATNKIVYILGAAYKPNINLLNGSPTFLLEKYLKELGVNYFIYDPLVEQYSTQPEWVDGIFFIAVPHKVFSNFLFPTGSLVLDPFKIAMDLQYGTWRLTHGRL